MSGSRMSPGLLPRRPCRRQLMLAAGWPPPSVRRRRIRVRSSFLPRRSAMRRQTAGIAILVLLFASLSFAQTAPVTVGTAVPPVIRFSGTLGVSPGPVPVTFSLYADQTGGEPLWQDTQTVAVDGGGALRGGARHDHGAAHRGVCQRRGSLAGGHGGGHRAAAAGAAGERAVCAEGGRRRHGRRQTGSRPSCSPARRRASGPTGSPT